MTWCSMCVSGMHLPAFAAAEGGLFAEQGLDVEFVGATKAPDFSLPGFTARVKGVAAGEGDFALSSFVYLLAAQTAAEGQLPVRFAAATHQRNPIVAVVRADSDLREPSDLPGARTARWSIPWYADEYAGALDYLGLGAPELVDTTRKLEELLAEGEIDVIPTWMDMTLYHLNEGIDVRIIPLDIPVYSTGLLASDRLSDDVVRRMRDAYAAGHQLQVEQPEVGLAGFTRRFPNVSDEHARANWDLYEPYAFAGVPPGSMDAERCQETIDYAAKAHRLSTFSTERMYRSELIAAALEPSVA